MLQKYRRCIFSFISPAKLSLYIHVRDGQDSHENVDFIFILLNARGEDAVIHIGLSSVPDFRPGKHPSSPLPAG